MQFLLKVEADDVCSKQGAGLATNSSQAAPVQVSAQRRLVSEMDWWFAPQTDNCMHCTQVPAHLTTEELQQYRDLQHPLLQAPFRKRRLTRLVRAVSTNVCALMNACWNFRRAEKHASHDPRFAPWPDHIGAKATKNRTFLVELDDRIVKFV